MDLDQLTGGFFFDENQQVKDEQEMESGNN